MDLFSSYENLRYSHKQPRSRKFQCDKDSYLKNVICRLRNYLFNTVALKPEKIPEAVNAVIKPATVVNQFIESLK